MHKAAHDRQGTWYRTREEMELYLLTVLKSEYSSSSSCLPPQNPSVFTKRCYKRMSWDWSSSRVSDLLFPYPWSIDFTLPSFPADILTSWRDPLASNCSHKPWLRMLFQVISGNKKHLMESNYKSHEFNKAWRNGTRAHEEKKIQTILKYVKMCHM